MLSKIYLTKLVEMKYKDLLCPRLNLKELKPNRQRRICSKISQGLQRTALLIRMIHMVTIDQNFRLKTQKLRGEQVRSLSYKEWPLQIIAGLFQAQSSQILPVRKVRLKSNSLTRRAETSSLRKIKTSSLEKQLIHLPMTSYQREGSTIQSTTN